MANQLVELSPFWHLLETNFPLCGLRQELARSLGVEIVQILEAANILQFTRMADEFPCPKPGGFNCPRKVIELSDGTYCAVCGNDPPECNDIMVTATDLEVVGVSPVDLCEALRLPLSFGGKPEKLAGLHHAYRAGTFVPAPGIQHPLFLLVRSDPEEYSVALEALRSRQEREGFAVLIPTDRFVTDDTLRQLKTLGVVVLPMVGLVNIDTSGSLVSEADPLRLFAGIGQVGPSKLITAGSVYAQLRTNDGWRNLGENEYRQLLENAADYEILADERSRTVFKNGSIQNNKPNANHFRMLRFAIEKDGYFDPAVDGPDEYVEGVEYDDPKQIFQRARQLIDITYKDADGHKTWHLFKTGLLDKHSVYQFKPDAEINFALIFVPSSQT